MIGNQFKIPWEIRPAKEEDIQWIVELSRQFDKYIHPYVLGTAQIKGYLEDFKVAYHSSVGVGGYQHLLFKKNQKTVSYLQHIRQMDMGLIHLFLETGPDVCFIGQTLGPPRTGINRLFVEGLKTKYTEIWDWLSVVSPVRQFYLDLGFEVVGGKEYKFMNAFKGDYSRFNFIKWTRK